ncbi:class I SAM-dependent methyltransferase [bacterium]|nr:class I SAM-dependent methyltransferase [bacterium]
MTYTKFSKNYDRFVNWGDRLAVEIPFLNSELASLVDEPEDRVRVLDTACGTGQHLMAFADLGYDCSGADISAGMVRQAKENIAATNHDIPIHEAGFLELTKTFGNQRFDAVLCLGNSLPHLLNRSDLLNALGQFRDLMRPEGKLILQMRNFDTILAKKERWMSPQTYHEDGRTWLFVRFYDFDPDGKITFNIAVLDDRGGETFQQEMITTRLWPLTSEIMLDVLEEAGFQNIRLLGDLQGAEYDKEKSGNLVVITRR